jgi:hypothetical protein
MKRRKPQPRCKCGHAKTSHWYLGKTYPCQYGDSLVFGVYHVCTDFKMGNLATLERLSEYYETRKNT